MGLLLYKGGTVCNDNFNDNAANAICREMGHSRSTSWKSGIDPLFGENQTSLDITLDDIKCSDNDWKSCSYSTSHNCGHNEDVFLSCQAGNKFIFIDLYHSVNINKGYIKVSRTTRLK